MAQISSFANENVLRNFNLINFTLPSTVYLTPYIDVSKYSYFNILASTDSPRMDLLIKHSLDASGSAQQELIETIPSVNTTSQIEDLGTFEVKSRFIRLEIINQIGALVNIQFLFR